MNCTALVLLIILALSIWFMVCAHRAHKQRLHIIDVVFDVPLFPLHLLGERTRALKAVSYVRHTAAMMLLCNPYKLYPEPLRSLLIPTKQLE